MAFTTVTVIRDYDLADGFDPGGYVTFTPTVPMTNGGVTVVAAPSKAMLDADGRISVELVANTDPATTPTGVSYRVVEYIDGQVLRTYSVIIPHDAGTTVDLGALDVIAGTAPPAAVEWAALLAGKADADELGGYAVIDPALSSVSGAIDATAAFATAYATGKPVLVPPGTYTVTSLAPPTRSLTLGAGESSKIRYAGTGTMCTLTSLQRVRFVDLQFVLTNAAATLFKVDGTFRASWTRCVFQGQHTAAADAYAINTAHIGVWLTNNAGDNLFYDCDFLNLGVGIKTDAVQNGVVGGKFGSCYNGIRGFGGGGMSLAGYIDFVGPVSPAVIVDKAINIDAATGIWWLDNVWIEGATTGISVGTGTTGPAQFSMTGSKVAATTTCIAMNACRNPTLWNVYFTGDNSGAATPDPLVIDATNAPEGVAYVDSVITGKAVTTSSLPKGWTAHSRSGSTSTLKVPDELQFSYQAKLRMARSDGSFADTLAMTGGPRLLIGAPSSSATGAIRFQDTSGAAMGEIDGVTSTVNYLGVVPAATGSGPQVAARGTDTNIDVTVAAKGTGQVRATTGMLYLATVGSAPSTPSGGGVVYEEAGLLKHKGTGGAIATAVPLPAPVAGQYFYTASPSGVSTSATLSNGVLRLYPVLIETTISIDRLGADVSVIGDSGSKVRLGIYADTGAAYPGALVLDAGQIAGDSATVQALTISTTVLTPGLYWFGGAVQAVTSVQPTVRILSGYTPPVPLGLGTSLPSGGGSSVGFSQSSVTGALPGTFTATVSAAGSAPRLIARTV